MSKERGADAEAESSAPGSARSISSDSTAAFSSFDEYDDASRSPRASSEDQKPRSFVGFTSAMASDCIAFAGFLFTMAFTAYIFPAIVLFLALQAAKVRPASSLCPSALPACCRLYPTASVSKRSA